MDVKNKYTCLRSFIENGDIILTRGKSLLSKTIRWTDDSYWNHALVVFKKGERLLAIQSIATGVKPDFLSAMIYRNLDFCIIKPLVSQQRKDECVDVVFEKGADGIPYNVWQLPKALIYKKLGINIKKLGANPHKNICSVFAAITYGQLIPLNCYSAINEKQGFITPQDMLRYADNSVEIIGEKE